MVSRRTTNVRRRRTQRAAPKRSTRKRTTGPTASGRRVRPKRAPRSATTRTRKRVGTRKGPRAPAKAAKDLAVFHDPFSKATQQARIPDGKATASLGTRIQNVVNLTPIADPNNTTGQETLHVLLYPGLGAGCLIQGTASEQFTDDREFYLQGFSDHGMLQQNYGGAAGSWPIDTETEDGKDIQLKQTNAFAKWRLVSQGLNIKLINNHETNDGWFECVRINQVKDASDYMVTTINDSNANNLVTVAPSTSFVQSLINDTNLCQEPSYQTGLLKDIHRHVFVNHPVTNECMFKELQEEYRLRVNATTEQLDAGTDVDSLGLFPGGKRYDLATGSSRAHDLIKAFSDQDHDLVYIRIHGRARGDATATQLLFHLCANHEVMYDSSRDISKYMMPGQSIPTMDAHYAKKKDSTAAADVNMGTSAMA